jgi:predicted transcriptional regulator with HTH domain
MSRLQKMIFHNLIEIIPDFIGLHHISRVWRCDAKNSAQEYVAFDQM